MFQNLIELLIQKYNAGLIQIGYVFDLVQLVNVESDCSFAMFKNCKTDEYFECHFDVQTLNILNLNKMNG